MLDPDPPKKQDANRRVTTVKKDQKGVDEDPKAVNERFKSVTKQPRGNANFVKVVRQGVVETCKPPQDPVKARLIKATERKSRKIVEKPIRESNSESSSESEMEEERSEAVTEELEDVTEESYAGRAARTGHANVKNVRNENLINMNNKLPGRACTACF